MKMMRLMIDAGLNKRCSAEGLLTELEKTKIMILPDGEKERSLRGSAKSWMLFVCELKCWGG
jgi:hypothetical protein